MTGVGENGKPYSIGLGSQLNPDPARRNTPPGVPTDRVRLHVALWKMAQALGLGWQTVDASRPDHELVEEIAAAVTPALARVFKEGFQTEYSGPTLYLPECNPYAQKT